MSKSKNMKALLIAGCFLAVLILFGISVIADSGAPSSVSPSVATGLVPAMAPGETIQPPSPASGIYSARPYSMVVIVPESVDPGMVVDARDSSLSKMPCLKPELKLERR